jgi:hypothetical protein
MQHGYNEFISLGEMGAFSVIATRALQVQWPCAQVHRDSSLAPHIVFHEKSCVSRIADCIATL